MTTLSRTSRKSSLRAGAILCWLLAAMLGATSCCPDQRTEMCDTPAQWRATHCTKFPNPAAGEQCPSAQLVANTCDMDVTSARVEGDKCCYQFPVPCL
jgi:hypothetical protein